MKKHSSFWRLGALREKVEQLNNGAGEKVRREFRIAKVESRG
jgi:hypothetical protein